MIGFNSGRPYNGGPFGNVTSKDFSMDDVNCTGEENNILDCPHSKSHNCKITEGAGVRCSILPMVKLDGGKNSSEGIVYVNGREALFVN